VEPLFTFNETKNAIANHDIPFQSDVSRSLSNQIDDNLNRIKYDLGDSSDLIIRKETITRQNFVFAVIHIDGISDHQKISTDIIEKLLNHQHGHKRKTNSLPAIEKILSVSGLKCQSSYTSLLSDLLFGETILLIDNETSYLVFSTKMPPSREIPSEPSTQTVIRGPKDSFTENLRTNTGLIRQRIQHPALRIHSMKIGEITRTDVALFFIKGHTDENLIKEVKHRLAAINTNAILDSSYIEKSIKNNQMTVFPTVINTERPDAVVGNLLEGRIAIMTAGSPFAIIAPATFPQFFQSPSDYYHSGYYAAFLRFLRVLCCFLTLFSPSLFVAIFTHHSGLLPTGLLVSVSAKRETVPLPLIVEALVVTLAFEVFRESTIRMPRAVGNAVSIVGSLIIGQAAVEAGFISPSMTILISLTAITNFVIPNYSMAISIRLLKYLLLIAGAYIGLYGITLVSLLILLHLCSIRSFEEPYFYPFGPFKLKSHKDTLIVTPSVGNHISYRKNEN